MIEADYIIVGAGSAGCVLANRLSEDLDIKVLLIEAGGSDRSVFIQMPSAFSIPLNTKKYAWQFHSEPEPGLNQRRIHCPRGKVIGGSSSINGMVYVRGHARDFDEWQHLGAEGWSFDECLPYFKKAEDWIGGEDAYRGAGGPLTVSLGNGLQNPLYRAFIEAGVEAGYPGIEDYNGKEQEGFAPMQMTVRDGVRWSTANAYLKPALHRPNLTLMKNTITHRLITQQGSVTGVEVHKGRQVTSLRAKREVILSAGAIGSPHLMHLSGIGDSHMLADAGIPVVHELVGIGQNLMDHLEFYFQFECKQPISLNSQLGLLGKGKIGFEWLMTKKGPGATNHFESCGFIRSNNKVQWPDIQYHLLPAAMRYDGKTAFDGHGFQLHVGHNKPKSRGDLTTLSNNPDVAPKIRFNYLQHDDDLEGFRNALGLSREIIHQPALGAYRGNEIQPGASVREVKDVDDFLRNNLETAYHPCGTCKMGSVDDPEAVVDSEGRVIGLNGLRVVDASIMPDIPNGNLNAPVIMLAEKLADAIKR